MISSAFLRVATLTLVAVAVPNVARAQLVSERGSATANFTGPEVCSTPKGVDKNKNPIPVCLQPTASELQAVQRRAALQAVERYAATGGETAVQAFDRVRESVRERFDDVVLSVNELNRSIDSTTRQVTVMVRVEINEARLRTMMGASSAVGQASAAEKSLMGMFMMAREQAAVERFDGERRVSVAASASGSSAMSGDTSRNVRESESFRGGTVTLNDRVQSSQSGSVSMEAQATRVESGSTIERADRVQYTVAPAQDLDSELSGRLIAAGFEAVDAAFLVEDATPPLSEAIRMDFGGGDDLKPTTLRRIAAVAQANELRYALVGTVDLGMPSIDDVTGNQRIFAKVSAKVYDVSGRIPRTVVNVGPEQYAGLGPDAGVAKTNALKEAARQTAKIVIDQLSNRQVR